MGSGLLDRLEENMVLVIHPRTAVEGRLDVTNEANPPCDGSGKVDRVKGDMSCHRWPCLEVRETLLNCELGRDGYGSSRHV
jgi:hypothetical protein